MLTLAALFLAVEVVVPTATQDQLMQEIMAAVLGGNYLLAACTALWLFFFILQGKAGFDVPFVSEWTQGLTGRGKLALVVLTAVALGLVTQFLAGGALGIGLVLAGVAAGVKIALGSMGIHGALKAWKEGAAGLLASVGRP